MDQVHVLNEQLADAARSFEAETGKQNLLDRGVAIATEIFSGCDYAGVSIVHRKGVIDTPAATNKAVRLLDELQFTLKEGPCSDAIWSGETVHAADLARDPRWPRWGPRVVADLGVASMLSYRLFTTGETLGAPGSTNRVKQMRSDNTANPRAATRARSKRTRDAALAALRLLDATGAPITFQGLAHDADVSRSWLYNQADLRAEIQRRRRRHQPSNLLQ
ncbi:MAG: GAF domain-containing protein [Cellulomonas sp.]